MSEHYIELVTWNRKMMLMYGDKLTGTQKAIGRRSNGLHTSINFVDRKMWFSCTTADGADGCRMKPIKRSHPYRQSIVRIAVDGVQESILWAKACEMADMTPEIHTWGRAFIHYGPNHIKYDKRGAMFAFISKWKIWKMHSEKMICNEACANVLLEVWPDLLTAYTRNGEGGYIIHDPATLTPDQFEYMVRHYFEHTDRPNQNDINSIIKEVNG